MLTACSGKLVEFGASVGAEKTVNEQYSAAKKAADDAHPWWKRLFNKDEREAYKQEVATANETRQNQMSALNDVNSKGGILATLKKYAKYVLIVIAAIIIIIIILKKLFKKKPRPAPPHVQPTYNIPESSEGTGRVRDEYLNEYRR